MALSISPTRRALLALTAGGVLFGLTVPLSKIALGWLDPAWLAVARFGLAAPALAWVARRRLRPPPPGRGVGRPPPPARRPVSAGRGLGRPRLRRDGPAPERRPRAH